MRRNGVIFRKILWELVFLLTLLIILVICTLNVYGDVIRNGWYTVIMEIVSAVLGAVAVVIMIAIVIHGMKSCMNS